MRKLLFVLALCFTIATKAQDTTKAKVITYDPFNTSSTDPKKDVKPDKNEIKWNLSLLTRGIFLFNYERVLSEHISLEAGIGGTYRDYSFEFYNEGTESDNSFFWGQNFNYSDYNITIKPGVAFEVSPRIYPTDGYFEGFYFAPVFRYRNYNIIAKDPVFNNDSTGETQTIKGSQNIGYHTSEYGFLIGYQTEQWAWYDITWDYYFGVSFRNNTYKDLKYEGNTLTIVDKTKSFPSIMLGIKIGILQF